MILRKAATIHRELGVLVPMPDDDQRLTQAMLKAVLLRRRDNRDLQLDLDLFAGEPEVQALETAWRDAWERATRNRTVFAQRRLKPEEVISEWRRQPAVLGSEDAVARFVGDACARLDAPLALVGRVDPRPVTGDEALALLSAQPSANVPVERQRAALEQALAQLRERREQLEALARERAQRLLEDHRRVREASSSTGSYAVQPCLPVDVVGVYVLLPDGL